ncbi:unnamed protein product [Acanthocheilonema viteae]|uniref:Uncharacterized protein n=1 Tax=Acanthocheilonema viteae TaxID=6277 RepID=A0A498SVS6_ACAVI|nr:unnamed protein product [Acanthocheilonema viteae]
MAQSRHVLERIQEWKTNFEKQGEAKLTEIRRLININDILETYFREIDQLPENEPSSFLRFDGITRSDVMGFELWKNDEIVNVITVIVSFQELRKSNFYEFISRCETTGTIVDEPVAEPSVSRETENRSKMEQKSNTWTNRLRGPRKLVPKPSHTLSNIKTPASRNPKPIVLKTPAGNVRVPRAITPKVQDGDDIKFRALRREEVAFSVAGTPVVAGNETEGDENIFLVNELLHARDEELTPTSRNVVQGMKRLIGRIRTSEIPEHF